MTENDRLAALIIGFSRFILIEATQLSSEQIITKFQEFVREYNLS